MLAFMDIIHSRVWSSNSIQMLPAPEAKCRPTCKIYFPWGVTTKLRVRRDALGLGLSSNKVQVRALLGRTWQARHLLPPEMDPEQQSRTGTIRQCHDKKKFRV